MVMSAINLSKYIITKCAKDNKPISNLQLQKILYCIQANYLKNWYKYKIAFYDSIYAWECGPVVPNAYYRFCGHGGMPITNEYEDIDIEQEDKDIIDPIVEYLRDLPPWELSKITNGKGSAWYWYKTYNNGVNMHKDISFNIIELYDQNSKGVNKIVNSNT